MRSDENSFVGLTKCSETPLGLSCCHELYREMSFPNVHIAPIYHHNRVLNTLMLEQHDARGGGGTPSVKLVGRLRGFDPPFSRHWEKI